MKPPYIRRVPKEKNYTVIDNNYLFDNRLSLKAKGLLSMMLSRPDDWIFHNDELISHSTDGEKSFRAGFKELQECGYVDRFPIYENRKIIRWVTVVNEVSETLERSVLAENLQVQNLQVGKVQVQKEEVQNLQVGNDTLLSTDINQVLKKPSANNMSSKPDRAYPFEEIINYLNSKCGKNYKPTTSDTQKFIKARMKEGFTLQDFKQVIDTMAAEWMHNSEMQKYLRPQTLFGTKFESYLNQKPATASGATPTYSTGPNLLVINKDDDED